MRALRPPASKLGLGGTGLFRDYTLLTLSVEVRAGRYDMKSGTN
jgi:hypothetical protein